MQGHLRVALAVFRNQYHEEADLCLYRWFQFLQRPIRQETYLRALTKLYPGKIEIIFGHFRTDQKSLPLVSNPSKKIRVFRTEEKGSDVNLAIHLLNDAWKKEFDEALVLSNDSDLAEAIRIVTSELGRPIGIINPFIWHKKRADQMKHIRSFTRTIRPNYLKTCQLPDTIPGTNIHKPSSWY